MFNPVEIQRFLGGIDYPLNKEQLVQHAQDQGADESIVQALQNLPDQVYNSASDVSKAIGQAV